ncbi:2TM domain-containing protein [Galbibacter mesophilus]|uniref:2TM domain-containing protein n=1 Tax=Galbibacter mesophilus TaxID=379069 RepID=UPI00191F2A02|nr:2TM domain-containing protein [Galbibacter mesophilus]MCM5663670.1 2TM domain-containing protein [Galbibacter mesophilus]
MQNSEKQNKYYRAKERVEELKKFYNSLTSYVLVITVLAGINYYVDQWNYPWFLWAAGPWGIGLLFHAAKVYGWNPAFSKDWEERKIKEYMEKEDENYTSSRWE